MSKTTPETTQPGPYDAFISYRHIEPDRAWAKWLHGALETYRTPKELVAKGFPERLKKVFRDEEELPASADLSRQITAALDVSKFLIVICSSRAPSSKWVNAEVEHFRRLGRHDRILALLIEGEPRDAFPAALTEIRRKATDAATGATREEIEAVEPLAADVRAERRDVKASTLRSHAKLRLMACMLGCRFDDLRQRDAERRARTWRWVGAGLAVMVLVLSGLTGFAFVQRREAQKQQGIAEVNAAAEVKARKRAEDINAFVTKALRSIDPYSNGRKEATILEAMVNAIKEIENGNFKNDPETEAVLQETIAQIIENMGMYSHAESLYSRALKTRESLFGPDDLSLASSLDNLGSLYRSESRRAEAEALYKRALAIRENVQGPDHPDVAKSLNKLGMLYSDQSKFERAEVMYKRALEILEKAHGDDVVQVAIIQANLGDIYYAQSYYSGAETLFQQALIVVEKTKGPDHMDVARILSKLASIHIARHDFDLVEPFMTRSMAILEKSAGSGHPQLADMMNRLALIYDDIGQFAQAEPLYKRALAIRENLFEADHPNLTPILSNLGTHYQDQGQYATAEPYLQRALAIVVKAFGPDHPDAAIALNNLASLYTRMGSYAEAERRYKEALAILEKAPEQDASNLAIVLENYAELYHKLDRTQEAKELDERVIRIRASKR